LRVGCRTRKVLTRFRVWGLRFGIWGLGLRGLEDGNLSFDGIHKTCLIDSGFGFRISDLGFRVVG
jgi:hypothetical protein